MKTLTIVGARPQFVKAAMLSRALVDQGIDGMLCHTGQHSDDNMSGIFLRELGLPQPVINLGIHGGGHGQQTGRMLEALERALLELAPDRVLVVGDTNSTLAGALAAAKLGIPVDHVEAGLRSFDRHMPEEINRVVADHICDRLFAPTVVAVANLKVEGVPDQRIHRVGDVMVDCLEAFRPIFARQRGLVRELGLADQDYGVVTVHRAANTDCAENLNIIARQLARSPIPVIWPLHPRTRAALTAAGIGSLGGQVHVIEPLGYLEMMSLVLEAAAVVTDSGGLQKEACLMGVPCVILRTETEWQELVDGGWARLAPVESGLDLWACVEAARTARPAGRPVDYGDGHAAERIARILAG